LYAYFAQDNNLIPELGDYQRVGQGQASRTGLHLLTSPTSSILPSRTWTISGCPSAQAKIRSDPCGHDTLFLNAKSLWFWALKTTCGAPEKSGRLHLSALAKASSARNMPSILWLMSNRVVVIFNGGLKYGYHYYCLQALVIYSGPHKSANTKSSTVLESMDHQKRPFWRLSLQKRGCIIQAARYGTVLPYYCCYLQ
jgi:hypothetical protein